MCSAGEHTTNATGGKAVRFWVDAEMLGQLRDHPAFAWNWPEWEIIGCLREIAAFLNTDPHAQMRAKRGA